MKILLTLFFEFFKTGLFAVGGGLATLPFLYDMAGRYSWIDASAMSDMIAISESTPGPIGVNMATYTGFNAGAELGGLGMGIASALVATLALVLPSLIVILIVARMLDKFQNNPFVERAFTGLRPAVCGLIASAALSVFVSACFEVNNFSFSIDFLKSIDIKAIVLFIILFIVNKKIKMHPIFLIIPAGILGILLKM